MNTATTPLQGSSPRISARAAERAQRETDAWKIVATYGLDGYNPEQIRQITGIDTRQIMAMSKAKKALLDAGKDPRDFATWLSVIEHEKAERETKREEARRRLPQAKPSQFWNKGKPTIYVVQLAPEALKGDPRVPERVVIPYHGDGHELGAAMDWAKDAMAGWRQKYQDVMEGNSKGFTAPRDPTTRPELTEQDMWDLFRQGKTYSEIVQGYRVNQVLLMEVREIRDYMASGGRTGNDHPPYNWKDCKTYESAIGFVSSAAERLQLRQVEERKAQAKAMAAKVPVLPGDSAGEEPVTVEEEEETKSGSSWPKGFGGDDRGLSSSSDGLGKSRADLRKTSDQLDDLAFISADAEEVE